LARRRRGRVPYPRKPHLTLFNLLKRFGLDRIFPELELAFS
jgi:hypothetical protein